MNHTKDQVNSNINVLLPSLLSVHDKQLDQTEFKPEFHFTFPIAIPFMHIRAFADHIGLSYGVVKGWVQNGYIPTIKVGRYDIINLVALNAQCSGESS